MAPYHLQGKVQGQEWSNIGHCQGLAQLPLTSLLLSKYLSLLPASNGFAPQDHSLDSPWRIVPA